MESNKTQRFSVDLERNEDLAKIVVDVEPGEKLKATLSVVSKDDKTLVVELDEVEEPDGVVSEADDEDEDEDDDFPAMKVARGEG
jgi:hypothetical protein